MNQNNSTIFLDAMDKLSKRLEYYGEGNITKITLLKLIYEYFEYSPSYECKKKLNSILSSLAICDPMICIDVIDGLFFIEDEIIINEKENIAPIIKSSATKEMDPNLLVFNFTLSDLAPEFYDANGDSFGGVEFLTLPTGGLLMYDGQEVLVGQILTDISLITFERSNLERFSSTIYFKVYDDHNSNPLPSNISVLDFDFPLFVKVDEKSPLGIVVSNIDSGFNLVITFNDLISNLNPPNNDQLLTDISHIRIDSINSNNTGIYKFKGSEIYEGLVMSAEDLSSGYLIYYAPEEYHITTDEITFSGRDSSTGNFIQ